MDNRLLFFGIRRYKLGEQFCKISVRNMKILGKIIVEKVDSIRNRISESAEKELAHRLLHRIVILILFLCMLVSWFKERSSGNYKWFLLSCTIFYIYGMIFTFKYAVRKVMELIVYLVLHSFIALALLFIILDQYIRMPASLLFVLWVLLWIVISVFSERKASHLANSVCMTLATIILAIVSFISLSTDSSLSDAIHMLRIVTLLAISVLSGGLMSLLIFQIEDFIMERN